MASRSERPTLVTGDAIPMRPFAASLPMALLQARESAMQYFRTMLAEYDLTEQQWRVLRALAAADGPMTVTAVADATFLLKPSLSRISANLEQRELIERSASAADQRSSELRLSADGRALVQRVAPHSESIYHEIERTFGRTRLRELLDDLHELATALDRLQPDATGETA